jgi:hypothetical protein
MKSSQMNRPLQTSGLPEPLMQWKDKIFKFILYQQMGNLIEEMLKPGRVLFAKCKDPAYGCSK